MAEAFEGWAIVEWRPVPDYEDLYEVSNTALIRRISTGHVLKPQPRPGGYQAVQLWRANRAKNVLIHCVVASAFIGRPPAGHETNHENGDKHQNGIANLEYLTRPDNMRHAYRTGLRQVTIAQAISARRKPRVMTSCACGCGQALETPDAKGRARRFISGHNMRRTAA